MRLATIPRGLPIRDLFRRLRHTGTGQRRAAPRVPALPVANERLDDFQSRARRAFGPSPFEICRQLPIRAKDFLIAYALFSGRLVTDSGFASLGHRSTPYTHGRLGVRLLGYTPFTVNPRSWLFM
ncbi:MAG: hypothetical protein A3G76_07950 [Acidobacteria bacterium RIFCSPLOWO2_12_FULL_65_11]|nr:MAG: hypothetical protein A3H95_11655 [Acidobacteria bacterium RIFCSPLOWO2_02_FULL_64_15]OFW31156.1 MAG: hypothetical protein A3G76_07950 [Acidobacteria bacterium RIFCSPLOWO2_12_FULL_65_11]